MILQKYQVLGNDFLIFDCINFEKNASSLQKNDFINFVVEKSDRRRLGCDQFIVMEKSQKADAKIVFYNSDGSKAEACGNGTVAAGVYASGFLKKNDITLETDLSIANVKVDGQKATIELPMPRSLHFEYQNNIDGFLNIFLSPTSKNPVRNLTTHIESVSVGNPHCVLIGDYGHTYFDSTKNFSLPSNISLHSNYDYQSLGKEIENCTYCFPSRTNVEFAIKIGENAFDVFVWERGAGRTFACGTGACAVAFACVKNGLADKSKPIEIYMEGSYKYGDNQPIIISFGENSVFLTNYASFEGKIDVSI